MNKKFTIFLLAAVISASAFAQGTFKKNYALKSDLIREYQVTPHSLIYLSDGGYAFTSRTQNKSFLCKADSNWNILWARSVYSDNNNQLNHIVEAEDKSLLITGGVYSPDISNVYSEILVAKYDRFGNFLWHKVINTGYDCIGLKIFEKGNGFVIATKRGYGDSRPFYAGLVEIDAEGNYIKAVDIDAPQFLPTDVTKAKNGYVFSGFYYQPNGSNKNFFAVVSVDSFLNTRWSKILNNGLGSANRMSITALRNGLLLAGQYQTDSGCYINLVRLKSNGIPIWSKSLNFGTCDYQAPSFSFINDTSFILGGNYPGGKTFLMNLDTSGTAKWAKSYNGGNSKYLPTRDKGFVMIMAAPGDDTSLVIIKTDSLGITCGDNQPITVTATDLRINNLDQGWTTIVNNVGPQSANLELLTADTAQTVICSDVVLPLTLLSFTAQHSGKTNKLLWTTANEINTAYFEIQRSTDGVNFVKLASVNAYGNSKSQNDYLYTDNIPLKSKNYYRIKMVDKDGRFTYSTIKQLDNLLAVDASVYPNPVKNKMMLTISSEKNTNATIIICDISGKIIRTQPVQLIAGTLQKEINVSSLSKGAYFLKIDAGMDKINLRFLVQ